MEYQLKEWNQIIFVECKKWDLKFNIITLNLQMVKLDQPQLSDSGKASHKKHHNKVEKGQGRAS